MLATVKPVGFTPIFKSDSAARRHCCSTRKAHNITLFFPPNVTENDATNRIVLPGSNIVLGHPTGDFRIKEVEFVKSSNRAKDCPRDTKPEFAFAGRSNVGKSSLINALVQKKGLALTSKRPGKTQVINHFLINKSWYMVDLPGYGFAHAADSARTDWFTFTKDYFLKRRTLVAVLLLMDVSTPPQKIDLDCADWLKRNNVKVSIVFTKCDKVRGGKETAIGDIIGCFDGPIRRIFRNCPPWIMTSGLTGQGTRELLQHITQMMSYWRR